MKTITLTRCKVATMANRLKKMGLSLSQAFKKAWELVKSESVRTKVRGVTVGNAQKALERLTHYRADEITVSLEREPGNLYDSNAVAVHVGVINKGMVKIGYLPAPLAKVVSALLDKGMAIKAFYSEIRGKYDYRMNYGLVIGLSL